MCATKDAKKNMCVRKETSLTSCLEKREKQEKRI